MDRKLINRLLRNIKGIYGITKYEGNGWSYVDIVVIERFIDRFIDLSIDRFLNLLTESLDLWINLSILSIDRQINLSKDR